MPKHRSTLYTVVREVFFMGDGAWVFSALVGIYSTLIRAEEMAGSSMQALNDVNPHAESYYRFTVVPTTFYDE